MSKQRPTETELLALLALTEDILHAAMPSINGEARLTIQNLLVLIKDTITKAGGK